MKHSKLRRQIIFEAARLMYDRQESEYSLWGGLMTAPPDPSLWGGLMTAPPAAGAII